MRMSGTQVLGLLGGAVLAVAVARPAGAQGSRWAAPKCDLKPGHFLVNSAVLYLKNATETKFEDQKKKDLSDANRNLVQALTTGGQDKNPAAWYYLARYYLMVNDLVGADSAFTQSEALKPDCKDDIGVWRRFVWVPAYNAGIAAWQANNLDSAIASFRRANAILHAEPSGFKYLATLYYNKGELDSAATYFRKAAEIAARGNDTASVRERKDALFNLARIYHSQKKWADAEGAYRDYLTLAPNDADGLASLGSVFMAEGKRDSAYAFYQRVVDHADSMEALPLLRIGVDIYQSVPDEPDTSAANRTCRTQGATATRPVPPVRVRACRDSVAAAFRAYDETAKRTFRLAAQAFRAGVTLNPYFRDGLFNLANTLLAIGDSASLKAMLPVARQLIAVDPMHRGSLRLMAFAHQRAGNLDSALHYLRFADSSLVAEVAFTAFDPQDQSAELKGTVTQLHKVTQPFKLTFEFLDTKGTVVGTQTVDVPLLQPDQTYDFDLKVIGAGVAGWRYRKEG